MINLKVIKNESLMMKEICSFIKQCLHLIHPNRWQPYEFVVNVWTKEEDVRKDDAEIEGDEEEDDEDSGDDEGDVDGERTTPRGKKTKSRRRRRQRAEVAGVTTSKTHVVGDYSDLMAITTAKTN